MHLHNVLYTHAVDVIADVPVKIVDAGVIQLNRWAHQHGLQCELLQCAMFKGTYLSTLFVRGDNYYVYFVRYW